MKHLNWKPTSQPTHNLKTEIFKKNNFFTYKYSNVKEALSAAVADSEEDDMVYVGGSTFVVADVF